MIRGCQKKILFVEGNENSPFETAYFVLRKDAESRASGEDDTISKSKHLFLHTPTSSPCSHTFALICAKNITICANTFY